MFPAARLYLLALLFLASNAHAAGVPDDCRQLIVAVAPDWDSSQGTLWKFTRERGGKWNAEGTAVPVLFGKNGLAWGIGLAGQEEPGLHKKERDGRAPAGVFRLGKIYTYDEQLPAGSDYPFRQVGEGDLWSDDPRSPNYNRHIVIDPANPPDNYSHEKMRAGDFAYRWLVEVRHNSDPPVPGEGSAIFFHIRRGVTRPTAGCTTMAEAKLVQLIRWLRKEASPCYALLPQKEYAARWERWNLPPPSALSGAE